MANNNWQIRWCCVGLMLAWGAQLTLQCARSGSSGGAQSDGTARNGAPPNQTDTSGSPPWPPRPQPGDHPGPGRPFNDSDGDHRSPWPSRPPYPSPGPNGQGPMPPFPDGRNDTDRRPPFPDGRNDTDRRTPPSGLPPRPDHTDPYHNGSRPLPGQWPPMGPGGYPPNAPPPSDPYRQPPW